MVPYYINIYINHPLGSVHCQFSLEDTIENLATSSRFGSALGFCVQFCTGFLLFNYVQLNVYDSSPQVESECSFRTHSSCNTHHSLTKRHSNMWGIPAKLIENDDN